MDIIYRNNKVIINGIKDFNLTHTFECGQCFRWFKEYNDDTYTGIAYNKVINIGLDNDNLIIKNTNIEEFNKIWKSYFDLDNNYSIIKNKLNYDKIIRIASKFGWGIRILKQEPWECLISFIISANNFIPRIRNIINRISVLYGEAISYNGTLYHTFPGPDIIYKLSPEQLIACGCGYRHKYITEAARMVLEGHITLEKIKDIPSNDGRTDLMKIYGVGPKIADCVLLFSFQKYNVFPTDVWIRKVMNKLYFGKDVTNNYIQEFAQDKYGNLAGFAQQYLYYYSRENWDKIDKDIFNK